MISRLWWFLIWPRVVVEGVALGPNRYAHRGIRDGAVQ